MVAEAPGVRSCKPSLLLILPKQLTIIYPHSALRSSRAFINYPSTYARTFMIYPALVKGLDIYKLPQHSCRAWTFIDYPHGCEGQEIYKIPPHNLPRHSYLQEYMCRQTKKCPCTHEVSYHESQLYGNVHSKK